MDREYFRGEPAQFGVSTPPFEAQLQALKARIREGATVVELGFTGTAKGSMAGKATTPEMYGKEEREAIRELAKVNKVELSVHGTTGVMGFAGLTRHGFSREVAEEVLHEIERTIDFAADTAEGGAVVFHIGEWKRPIAEVDNKFATYPEEAEKEEYVWVADAETGNIEAIPKVHPIFEPKIVDWKVKEGKKVPVYAYDEQGKIVVVPKRFEDVVNEERKRDPEIARALDEGILKPEQVWLKHFFESQKLIYEAEATRWTAEAEERRKKLESINELLVQAKKPGGEKLIEEFLRAAEMAPPPGVNIIEHLEEQKRRLEVDIEWMQKSALSSQEHLENLRMKEKMLRPLKDVGLERTTDTIARAGLYAYDQTQVKGLKRPILVSPEPWLPEYYGSHPSELAELIQKSREKMAQLLAKERGISKSEALKIAEKHIGATFDIGHAYTWRKFFEPKPGETFEQADKRFNKWLIDSVRELFKKGIIGHVQMSDNFGYYDEHLPPGSGKAPIKEFLEEMKKAKVEIKPIVEPAHHDIRAWHAALRSFGGQVYGIGNWADIEHSYFGRTQPPYFATGEFLPVQREWQMSYFGIPFE